MARRRHLIAYDIADPQRLRRVCKLMEEYGERLQYSVFVCDLSRGEKAVWQSRVMELMNLSRDSVITIDLGPVESPLPVRTIGRGRELPQTGPRVV